MDFNCCRNFIPRNNHSLWASATRLLSLLLLLLIIAIVIVVITAVVVVVDVAYSSCAPFLSDFNSSLVLMLAFVCHSNVFFLYKFLSSI